MMEPTLLIVDDERNTREGLRRAFDRKFEVYLAADIESALNILNAESIDLVLTDLRIGTENGMELLEKCKLLPHRPICYMMTAYGGVDTAVEAMQRGAAGFETKPLNLEKLEMVLLRAARSRDTERENVQLRQELDQKYGLENIIGKSRRMVEIFDVIKQVAQARASILIEGESGTGKELVAHAIHNLSPRKNKPFVPVHCAALSAQLLESELFGHEKGAFTGAQERRIGRFEQANGGTIFLDEIGEIDTATQVKLLRVLGERSFERVGGNKRIDVDVRLVAATNRNLEEMVKEDKFREDLFFRINVVRIETPPLRDRREDIPLLTQSFLKEFCEENGKPLLEISEDAENALLAFDWPGNVRQLRTAIEHAVVLCRGDSITLPNLPDYLRDEDASNPIAHCNSFNLQEVERSLIIKALERCEGNRTEAAKLLGISRRTLHRKINEYGLT